jgi:hypothetical protein
VVPSGQKCSTGEMGGGRAKAGQVKPCGNSVIKIITAGANDREPKRTEPDREDLRTVATVISDHICHKIVRVSTRSRTLYGWSCGGAQ